MYVANSANFRQRPLLLFYHVALSLLLLLANSTPLLAHGNAGKIARFINFLEQKRPDHFLAALSTHDDFADVFAAIPLDLLNDPLYAHPGYAEEMLPLVTYLALQTAAEGEIYENMLAALLATPGVSVDQLHSRGSTPLMWAAQQAGALSSVRSIDLLISAGADINAVSTQSDTSVFAFAIEKEEDHSQAQAQVVALLLQRGVDLYSKQEGQPLAINGLWKAPHLVAVMRTYTAEHGINLAALVVATTLSHAEASEDDVKSALAILDEEYKNGAISDETMDAIDQLNFDDVKTWLASKGQWLTIKRNSAEQLRRLQALVHAETSKAKGHSENPDSNQDCSICAAKPGQTWGHKPICGACAKRWYEEGGELSGLGVVLSEDEEKARASKMTADDLRALGLSEREVLTAEVNQLRNRLKGLRGWRFCTTRGCFNGKQWQEGEDLAFSCQLCEQTSCLGCGEDHTGPCDKDERTRLEVQRLTEAGRKRPDPANPDSDDGKFRPCYYCGILTERVDGCSTMRCSVCKHSWDWTYGDPASHPRYAGSQVHDFEQAERQYEPQVPAHL